MITVPNFPMCRCGHNSTLHYIHERADEHAGCIIRTCDCEQYERLASPPVAGTTAKTIPGQRSHSSLAHNDYWIWRETVTAREDQPQLGTCKFWPLLQHAQDVCCVDWKPATEDQPRPTAALVLPADTVKCGECNMPIIVLNGHWHCSMNPYAEDTDPVLPTEAQGEDWKLLEVGEWFFVDSPSCTHRYSVQERTDGGCSIVCSTPYHHDGAKKDMQDIAKMHNLARVETGAHPSQDAPTADQWWEGDPVWSKWPDHVTPEMVSQLRALMCLFAESYCAQVLRARSTPSLPAQEAEIYLCPDGCGCTWRDNRDGSMSLAGPNSKSCKVCEFLPLKKLIPLWRGSTPSPDPPHELQEPSTDEGLALIRKIELLSNPSTKLMLLRNFAEKYAAAKALDTPPRKEKGSNETRDVDGNSDLADRTDDGIRRDSVFVRHGEIEELSLADAIIFRPLYEGFQYDVYEGGRKVGCGTAPNILGCFDGAIEAASAKWRTDANDHDESDEKSFYCRQDVAEFKSEIERLREALRLAQQRKDATD